MYHLIKNVGVNCRPSTYMQIRLLPSFNVITCHLSRTPQKRNTNRQKRKNLNTICQIIGERALSHNRIVRG